MTQVWMVRNSDTDIHVFNRFEHIEPSVKISYSTCEDVTITSGYEPGSRDTWFEITGKRNGEQFKDRIIAERFPVWTEPCHL